MEIDIMYELSRYEIYLATVMSLATLAAIYISIDIHKNPYDYGEDFDEESDKKNFGLENKLEDLGEE
jgi:hypothetical protein